MRSFLLAWIICEFSYAELESTDRLVILLKNFSISNSNWQENRERKMNWARSGGRQPVGVWPAALPGQVAAAASWRDGLARQWAPGVGAVRSRVAESLGIPGMARLGCITVTGTIHVHRKGKWLARVASLLPIGQKMICEQKPRHKQHAKTRSEHDLGCRGEAIH